MIAPRMREDAYDSNFTARPVSYFSIASMRPNMPYETRSACSTVLGRRMPTRPATADTSGA